MAIIKKMRNMPKVYAKDKTGRVSLRKISRKTLDKEYLRTPEKMYVYKKANLIYDPLLNDFYWQGAKRKNRRSGRKAYIYVRMRDPLEKGHEVFGIDSMILSKEKKHDDPTDYGTEVHVYFSLTPGFKNIHYRNFDFGNYEESWKVGLLSDVLHEIMYNPGKDLRKGRWHMWRIPDPAYPDKAWVKNIKTDIELIHVKTFKELIEEIEKTFEESEGVE